MKFVIKNDTFYMLYRRKIFILIYYFCLIIVALLLKTTIGNKLIISQCLLGIKYFIDANVILKIFMIYNFTIYIYIAYDLFLKDIRMNYGNIFSRITKIKWILGKLVSIFIITFLIKIITYLLIYIIFGYRYNLIQYFFNFLFICFWQIIFLIGYIAFFKSKIYKISILFLMSVIIMSVGIYLPIITSEYYNKYILLLLNFLTFLFYLKFGSRNINFISERNE